MFRQFQHDNAYFPAHCRPNLSASRLARLYMKMTEEHSSCSVVDEDQPCDASDAVFNDYLDSSFLENLSGASEAHSDPADALADDSASLTDDSASLTDDSASNVSSDSASTDDITSAVDDSSTSADEASADDQSSPIDDSSASESNNAPSSSASNTLAPNMLSFLRVLNSPVEASYWTDLGLATSSRARVYQISDGNHNGLGPSAPSFRVRGDLPLSELQVIGNPFISCLSSLDDVQESWDSEEEEISPEEQIYISPLAVSVSSDTTGEDTVDEPCKACGDSPALPDTPEPTKRPCEVHSLGDEKTFPVSVPDAESHEARSDALEPSRHPSNEEPAKVCQMPENLPPSRRAVAVAAEGAAPQEKSAAGKLMPADPFSSTNVTPGIGEPGAIPAATKKRKRIAKAHAATELRMLSVLPPERKIFSLPVRTGRATKTGINKVRVIQVEAESCRHLAGGNGLCQFQLYNNSEEKCLAELPKDDKAVRAHFAIHTDTLGWREYSKQHPNWEPICPWCGEPRTKFEQLTRHILDTHLLMFAEWCPCGGTNSRANHKPHTVRHEDSDVHKAYLRQMAKGKARAVKQEDTGDEQEEFVQGSSKGTKRKRLR